MHLIKPESNHEEKGDALHRGKAFYTSHCSALLQNVNGMKTKAEAFFQIRETRHDHQMLNPRPDRVRFTKRQQNCHKGITGTTDRNQIWSLH